MQSSIGDDVYFEPSTAALEAHMAKITGKEAGIFMASGSMSNQIALRSHLKQPPYSVLLDLRSHINKCSRSLVLVRCSSTHLFI
jgi:threonine aldolase